jgi:hypothetical protein
MNTYNVSYIVQRKNSGEVLVEGTQAVTCEGGRYYAEKQIKAMYERDDTEVNIRSVFPA